MCFLPATESGKMISGSYRLDWPKLKTDVCAYLIELIIPSHIGNPPLHKPANTHLCSGCKRREKAAPHLTVPSGQTTLL